MPRSLLASFSTTRRSSPIDLDNGIGWFRLADEYDAAQERGEIKSKPGPNTSGREVTASVSDIGLTHKDIHEARIIRDAENIAKSG